MSGAIGTRRESGCATFSGRITPTTCSSTWYVNLQKNWTAFALFQPGGDSSSDADPTINLGIYVSSGSIEHLIDLKTEAPWKRAT
jgi:hypothetical protein